MNWAGFLMKKDNALRSDLLFVLFVGCQFLLLSCSPTKNISIKPVAVKDLVNISVDAIFDKAGKVSTYKITEKFKIRPDLPVKTIEMILPKAKVNLNADPKSDSSKSYFAKLLFEGEGYAIIKNFVGYEEYKDTDAILTKFFLKNGILMKKTLIFPEVGIGEDISGETNAWIILKKNKIVYFEEGGGPSSEYFPGEIEVYDLNTFEPVKKITRYYWDSLDQNGEWIRLDDWLKGNYNH